MGVLHGPAGLGGFEFDVAYHTMGIADILDIAEKVNPRAEFEVEVRVMCMTAGCDLMGLNIEVVDEAGNVVGTGSLTGRAWNARYMKYEYFGKVKVTAPSIPGAHTWYGRFPHQELHGGVSDDFTFTVALAVAYTLTVKSDPPGVKVIIDGVEAKTPHSWGVSPGTYTVEVPEEGFIEWEDGSTDPVRTIEVTEDTTIIAYFKAAVPWTTIAVVGGSITVVIGSIIYAATRKEK